MGKDQGLGGEATAGKVDKIKAIEVKAAIKETGVLFMVDPSLLPRQESISFRR
jgi:hypothetical protein